MSVPAFITRWQAATGSELANAQLFVTELCELLGLPRPNPATGIAEHDAYVFERRTQHQHGDASRTGGVSGGLRALPSRYPTRSAP